MVISGSTFAKEAADMVYTESDIKHIVNCIKEGRLLYANLKKTIAYTLAHMLPELCAVMLAFAIGFPIGLSSLQVLITLFSLITINLKIWSKSNKSLSL